jgi:hypothetical protein
MKLIAILLTLFFGFTLQSQTIVKGRVLDSRTKEVLPFCTIYFEGKKIGSKSDNFGNFFIKSPKEEKFVYISFVGYETKKVEVFGSEFKTDVYLAEKSKKTKEVKITGKRKLEKDTIAIRIIRNVIKNKSKNKPSAFESIEYDKYTKFEVDIANVESVLGRNFITKPLRYMLEYQSETPDGEKYSPLLFRETSARFYQKGNKKKTVVLGVKDTRIFDNESLYSLVSYAFEDYSIYDNNVIIANKSLLGPAANGALIFYRYYVEDSFEVDGKKNYRLSFAPVSKEDFGFTGKILVEEGTWAIKHADITLDKRANINFMNHFAMSQAFRKVGDKWVCYKDEKDIAMSISREAKKFIKLRFRQSELMTNEVINQPIEDGIFVGEEVVYNEDYRKKTDDAFWDSKRAEKLTTFEDGIYKRSDTFTKSKQFRTLKYMLRVATTGFFPVPPANWELGRYFRSVSRNEYEGTRLRFGGRIIFDSFPRFNIGGHLAYGIKDNQLKYGLQGIFNLPSENNNFHQLQFSTSHDYQRVGESESLMAFDNVLLSLFRPPSNLLKDIILREQHTANWVKEWKRGEETNLGFDYNRYFPNSFYTLNEIQDDGSVIARENLTTVRFNASYRFAIKEPVFRNKFIRRRMKSIRPIMMFNTSVGLKDLMGSDYSFMRLKGNITHSIPFVFGQFKYNITAGKIFGRVPYIDIEQFGGNNGLISDENRYMLMNEGEYSADQFASVWLQHKFQGYFLNKIPLLKKLGWRERVFFKGAVGTISDRNRNYYQLPNNMSSIEDIYAETGFGISNIFKVFEANFAWRLTQREKRDVRTFGFLVGFNFEI